MVIIMPMYLPINPRGSSTKKGRRASQQGVVALLAHAIEQRAVCPRAKMQEIGGAFVGAIDRDRAEVGEIGCPATKAWCVLQGIVMSAHSVPGNAHILVRALYAEDVEI